MHPSPLFWTTTLSLGALLAQQATACPLGIVHTHEETYHNERRSAPGYSGRTAIQNVRVFNGHHFSRPKTVCIDAGLIAHEAVCNTNAKTIDATHKFLIPGLIDSHVHLTDVHSLEDYTSYGLTTAMNMNCRNLTQCNALKALPGLANVVTAGMAAVGNGSLHSFQDPFRNPATFIYPLTDVKQYVAYQFNNGSDFHKITAEVNGPSLEQQVEMVCTAHDTFAKQTMTHASTVDAYTQATLSLTDGIQHVPDDGPISDAVVAQIRAQGQFVTPTLNIFEYAYTEPALQQFFHITPGSNRTLSHAHANARRLFKAGIPLIAGTDAVGALPFGNTTISVPWGVTLHQELHNLVQTVGMTPAQALNAATREAARWHRVADRGAVEVGLRADLVLLGSNPLTDIANTRDLERVWVLGTEVAQVARRG